MGCPSGAHPIDSDAHNAAGDEWRLLDDQFLDPEAAHCRPLACSSLSFVVRLDRPIIPESVVTARLPSQPRTLSI